MMDKALKKIAAPIYDSIVLISKGAGAHIKSASINASRIKRAAPTVIIVAISSVVLSACGVPEDNKPRSIPPNEVLYSLLSPSTTQTPTTLPTQNVVAKVFFMSGDRLVVAERKIASPPSLGLVLSALAQGPTDNELSEGLRTAIDPQAIVGSQISEGTAVINVSDTFSTIRVEDQVLALAQLVYTATAWEGVNNIRVQLNGMPVDMPRGDGSTTQELLQRSDYEKFAPLVQ